MEAWDHGVLTLSKIPNQYPKTVYTVLGMFLQLEWQCLQRTVSEVDNLMGKIEMDLREPLLSVLFWGEEININLWQLLVYRVKYGDLGIQNPHHSL